MNHDILLLISTGLKIFGEGEWKVRQHGYDKRRTWRKLHLGVDESTQEIVASLVTTNDIKDSQVLGELLDQVDDISQVSADGMIVLSVINKYLNEKQNLLFHL